MEIQLLFYVSIILISGIAFGRLVKFIKLPNVTGYLIAGLLIGPSVLKILPENIVSSMSVVSTMALGFIAFSIGGEFKLSYVKRVGITPVIIALFEALMAVIVTTGVLIAFGNSVPFSIVLGAIAAATAPAATIMVIRQYKAKGIVTETLMSVVALDDAVALIAFGFAVTIAKLLMNPSEVSIVTSLLSPLYEIVGSIVLGFVMGALFTVPMRWFQKPSNRLILVIGFVFFASALASVLNFSALLVCMCMGAMFVNLSSSADNVLKVCENFTPPLFVMFFVLSGAELDISVLPSIGVVGIIYVLMRVAGKMLGAYVGAKICKAPEKVQKYLGPTLIPQAGVAIGLSLLAAQAVPEYASVIRAVVLCATLIYELIGPAVTKISLQKAGEISKNIA